MPYYILGSLFDFKMLYISNNVFLMLCKGREGNLLIRESKSGSGPLGYIFTSLLH